MKLHLEEITRENWLECVRVRVTPNQARYVPNNLYSLAESKFLPERIPLGIYDDQTMVGLVVCSYDEAAARGRVHRLVIGEGFENRGYSTTTMQVLIRRFRRLPGCTSIAVEYRPENAILSEFYKSYGFVEAGQAGPDGELTALLRFPPVDSPPEASQNQDRPVPLNISPTPDWSRPAAASLDQLR